VIVRAARAIVAYLKEGWRLLCEAHTVYSEGQRDSSGALSTRNKKNTDSKGVGFLL
jgi:hypothetical protein